MQSLQKSTIKTSVGISALLLSTVSANAFTPFDDMSVSQLFFGTIILGALGIAALLTATLFRERQKHKHLEKSTNDALIHAQYRLRDIENLLLSELQVRLIWDGAGGKPKIFGDTSGLFPGLKPRDFIQFERWVSEDCISEFRQSINGLLKTGMGFRLELKTPSGSAFDAEGIAAGASALVTLKPHSQFQQQITEKEQLLAENRNALNEMEHFLDTLPHPVWLRDRVGKLRFVNRAFAAAVEQPQTADAVLRNMEFLDSSVVQEIERRRVANEAFAGAVNATAAGARRTFEVIDRPFDWGSAGFAVDVTDTDKLKRERAGEMASLRRTFDMLGTAVALFDADKKLIFYNNPFAKLFGLNPAFLDGAPGEGELLDRLRDHRKLPEESNYRLWKEKYLSVYAARSDEAIEDLWYLPDRSSLRVIRVPNPQGGVTALFEDLTEKLKLEMQYSALNRVQNETLENLNEAVVVFSADGRLSLWNDSYASIWELNRDLLKTKPHFDRINEWCSRALLVPDALAKLRDMVVSLNDVRESFSMQIELISREIYDVLAVPLPDGGTLVTYRDVTRDVEAERLLHQRNEKLVEADKMKTAFVEHVSYQLRTPLTTVMGYTEVLQAISESMDPRQREYLSHISSASGELNRVIDTILDFAGLEAGTVTLDIARYEIRPLLIKVIDAVKKMRPTDGVKLSADLPKTLTHIRCDANRLMQVLHNLLENAISFAKINGNVTLKIRQEGPDVVFTIKDDGPGIDPSIKDQALKPFITAPGGTTHRGMGLGLSTSKMLVEMHGGTLELLSVKDQGTTVIVRLQA